MTFIYSMSNPFPQIFSLQGTGLNDGDIYIGVAGQDPQTFPQTVYWDADATIPAAQPLETSGGYIVREATPATVYIENTYSIRVLDRNGAVVYYQSEVLDPTFALVNDLFSQFAAPTGAGLIGTTSGDTVQEELTDLDASVTDLDASVTVLEGEVAALTTPLTPVVRANPTPGFYTLRSTFNDQLGSSTILNGGSAGWRFLSSRYDVIDFTKWMSVTNYYVSYSTGNDSWDGLSPTFTAGTNGPWKTKTQAETTINGLSAGAAVVVHFIDNVVGTLSGLNYMNGTAGNGKFVKYKGEGSQGFTRYVNMREDRTKASFAWVAHGSNGAWKSNAAGIAGNYTAQFDTRFLDGAGIPTPIISAGQSAATVMTTEGTSYWDGTYLYVHMVGGVEPDPFNNWLYCNNGGSLSYRIDSGTMLLENFEIFCGGNSGNFSALNIRSVTDGNFLSTGKLGCKNVKFYGSSGEGLGFFDWQVCVTEQCASAYHWRDPFNYHAHQNTGTKGQYITIYEDRNKGHSSGYYGFNYGSPVSNSNNVSTSHDGVSIVRAGCNYWNSEDLTVYDVGGVDSQNYGIYPQGSVDAATGFPGAFGYEKLSGEGRADACMLIVGGNGGNSTKTPGITILNTGIGNIRLSQWAGDPNAGLSCTSTGKIVNDATGAVLYPVP